MASIYGTSAAWKEINSKLQALQLQADTPQQIESLLQSCQQTYQQEFIQAIEALEDEIVLLEQDVFKERENIKQPLDALQEKYALEIEQAETNLDFYKNDRSIFNLLRRSSRLHREAQKLAALRKNQQTLRDGIEQPLRLYEAQLAQKKANKESTARQQCSPLEQKIKLLQQISASQALANASAGLEMLGHLKNLPQNAHIFTDINLKIERGVRLDGKWSTATHIDHLVLTPAGLFAIQVASKQSAEISSAANPYAQINDAAQDCHALIKANFPGVSVRSILAYRNHQPENKNKWFVKALPLPEVCAYISWFKEPSLNETQQLELASALQKLIE